MPINKIVFCKTSIFNALLIIYGMIFFTLPSGISFLPLVLLLFSFYYLIKQRHTLIFEADERRIYFVLALYFIGALASLLINQDALANLDEPTKFLFTILLIMVIARHRFDIHFFWLFILFATLSNVVYVVWLGGDFYQPGFNRLSSDLISNPLYFGNLSLLFGFLSLSGLIWTQDKNSQHKKLWIILFLLGFVGGVYLSIMSGTRGGWVAIPFVSYFVLYHYAKAIQKTKLLNFGFVLSFLLIGFMFFLVETPFKERLMLISKDIEIYLTLNESYTSSGLRLEMWKVGMATFLESPIFGAGVNGYAAAVTEVIQQGKVIEELGTFHQLHNQFIQELAFKGVVGLVSLVLLFGVFMRFFIKRLNSKCYQIKSLAVAGALTCMLYLFFFLSITMFHLNKTTLPFLIIVALTVGQILYKENAQRSR
ncbi:MAG: O-antigen ligase family protein [Thiotrichales bacterium]|nr:O-antigen ligase family protein [Thiotrichales bacterium]